MSVPKHTDMHQACAGGCHCGAVRFEADLPQKVRAYRCNCSICQRSGFIHVFVPAERFRLLQGEGQLTEYRFHTGTARHLFCRICGIKSFYVPRSHPDGYSVNLNCLDDVGAFELSLGEFDGRHWTRSIEALHQATGEAGSDQ